MWKARHTGNRRELKFINSGGRRCTCWWADSKWPKDNFASICIPTRTELWQCLTTHGGCVALHKGLCQMDATCIIWGSECRTNGYISKCMISTEFGWEIGPAVRSSNWLLHWKILCVYPSNILYAFFTQEFRDCFFCITVVAHVTFSFFLSGPPLQIGTWLLYKATWFLHTAAALEATDVRHRALLQHDNIQRPICFSILFLFL